MSESGEHLSLAEALRGRKVRLAAIGLGSVGVEGLFRLRLALALLCLVTSLALFRWSRGPARPR